MRNPRFSKAIRWWPWIGRRYWQGGPAGRRLLILGESHYSGQEDAVHWDRDNNCLTRETINDQGRTKQYSYYTKLACAVEGKDPWEVDRARFWSTVSFYNYVQDIVGVGARVRPTGHHWREAEELLAEVIDKLLPTHIIATGWDLWRQLPDWKQDLKLSYGGEKFETCVHMGGNGHVFRATYIWHPARPGFGKGSSWHALTKAFLSLPLPSRAATRKKMRA